MELKDIIKDCDNLKDVMEKVKEKNVRLGFVDNLNDCMEKHTAMEVLQPGDDFVLVNLSHYLLSDGTSDFGFLNQFIHPYGGTGAYYLAKK